MAKKSKDIIAKVRQKYDLPENLTTNELIAFLLTLIFKHRKRRKAAAKKKKDVKEVNPTLNLRGSSHPIWPPPQATQPPPPAPTVHVITQPAQPPALPQPTDLPRLPMPPGAAPSGRRNFPVVLLPDGSELPAVAYPLDKDEKGNDIVAYGTPEFGVVGDTVQREFHEQREAYKQARAEAKRKHDEAAAHKAVADESQKRIDAARTEAEAKFQKGLHGFIWAKVIESHPEFKKFENKSYLKTAIKNYVVAKHSGDADAQQKLAQEVAAKYWHEIIPIIGEAKELFPPELQQAYDTAKTAVLAAHRKEMEDKFGPGKVVQRGGALPQELNNLQIDQAMKKYTGYLGTIAHDQIKTLLPFVRPHHDMGFIINTDKSGKPGTHWQAIFVSPDKDRSVEFYDSFGRNPDPKIMPDIHALVKRLGLPYHLKFKINRVEEQDADSESCGYYCIKFLVDRFRGDSFKKATGFPHDEKQLDLWKKQFPPFKYIDV